MLCLSEVLPSCRGKISLVAAVAAAAAVVTVWIRYKALVGIMECTGCVERVRIPPTISRLLLCFLHLSIAVSLKGPCYRLSYFHSEVCKATSFDVFSYPCWCGTEICHNWGLIFIVMFLLFTRTNALYVITSKAKE